MERTPSGPPASSGPAPPGDTPPPGRLEQPPSERFNTRTRVASPAVGHSPFERGSTLGALWGALAAGAAGAAIFAALAGPLSLDVGLLIVAAFIGWEVASGIRIGGGPAVDRRRRLWLAVGFTLAALTAGEVLTWMWARSEGGALPLLEHLWTVYGPLLPLEYILALAAASWTAR